MQRVSRVPPNPDPMRDPNQKLLREIIVVVVLKLVALVALWMAFVQDRQVPVSGEEAAGRLLMDRGTRQ